MRHWKELTEEETVRATDAIYEALRPFDLCHECRAALLQGIASTESFNAGRANEYEDYFEHGFRI